MTFPPEFGPPSWCARLRGGGKAIEDGSTEEVRKPKNQLLVASIETARLAVARSFYTDQADLFPAPGQDIWWEVWVRKGTRASFDAAAQALGLGVREHSLEFAERDVVVARGTPEQLGRVIANTDSVAELRLARDTPSLYMGMDGAEQRDWSAELVDRLEPLDGGAPAVCLLDSGTTIGHPLIAPYLAPGDQQAFDAAWNVEDLSLQAHGGHGTQMSGTLLYGDLMEVLDGAGPVAVRHRLESVKILPDHGANDPDLYGAITAQAIARAEIAAPNRPRAICLAITSPGDHGRGRPSAWSAKLDAITFGRDEVQRFIAVAAGNIREPIVAADYPARNDTMPIESPAQAWNALTVGAFTERTLISDPTYAGWNALGLAGDIMPRSRTSVSWIREWPLKPDVVFEGGNIGHDPATGHGDHVDDLALLTTYRRTAERPFTTTGDTSAATALAARMPWPRAALLQLDPATLVQLRITLSYFIEPNPGERGLSRRHVYASHGLRFDLKHADDSLDTFLRRRTSEAGARPPKRPAADNG